MAEGDALMEQDIMDKIRGQGTMIVAEGASLSLAGYICAIQNSSLARWCALRGETILIPKLTDKEQRPFVRLVDEILAANATDPNADTQPLEWEIDRLVYDLYGLTEEEDTAVERALGLIHQTDEEEDAALLRAMLESKEEARAEGCASREEVMAILRELDGS